jgi:prepilin-type N-terminal cleavage/methylation domain-containing protein
VVAVRLGGERGFTLVELLVGMALSTGLLGATLTTFNHLYQGAHDNDARTDTAEVARNALDVQARELRNLAKRVSSPVIDTLSSYDVIFQTSEPSRTWVRYCLDTTAPASADRARLWTAELVVADAAAAQPVSAAIRAGCAGSGWTVSRVVADYVTNRRAGRDRPLFEFGCVSGATCTSPAASYDQVVSIGALLIVDTTPGAGTPELRVQSGVYLRNQNQAPVASFASTPSSTSRTVMLYASASSDAEGRTLDYYWFAQLMPGAASIDCAHPTVSGSGSPRTLWGAGGYIGDGITLAYTFAPSDGDAGASRNIGLVVCDPGDRQDSAGIPPEPAITVQIPA